MRTLAKRYKYGKALDDSEQKLRVIANTLVTMTASIDLMKAEIDIDSDFDANDKAEMTQAYNVMHNANIQDFITYIQGILP